MPWNPPISLDDFTRRLAADGKSVYTVRNYALVLRRAIEAGDPVAPLQEAASASTWTVANAAMRKYAEYAGMTPLELLGPVKPHGRPSEIRDPAPQAAWEAIVHEAQELPEPHRSAMLLVLLSGLRIGGSLGLDRTQASRLASGEATVVIGEKRGSRKWSPDDPTRDILRDLLRYPWNRVGEVFSAKPRRAQDRVRELLQELCTKAKVPYYVPHAFRHSLGTYLMEGGVDQRTVQEILGHKDPRTTARYQHPSPERQMAAKGSLTARILGRKP